MARQVLKSPTSVHPPTSTWLPIGHPHSHEWSTHIPFVPCQSAPFLKDGYFKLWPWNYKIKVIGVVKGQDHTVNSLSNWFPFFLLHVNQITIPEIQLFDLEKSKVHVMGEVKGQGHIDHPVSNRCTPFSCHINRTNHSWDITNGVFNLEKKHIRKFQRKFCKKRFSTITYSKSNLVISMNR